MHTHIEGKKFYSLASECHFKSKSAIGVCVCVCVQSPAGGCLVDACCLSGSSGGLCVAAAGKWAVCLWSQTSASDWSLLHTWSFNEVSVWVCMCKYMPAFLSHRLIFFFFIYDVLAFAGCSFSNKMIYCFPVLYHCKLQIIGVRLLVEKLIHFFFRFYRLSNKSMI